MNVVFLCIMHNVRYLEPGDVGRGDAVCRALQRNGGAGQRLGGAGRHGEEGGWRRRMREGLVHVEAQVGRRAKPPCAAVQSTGVGGPVANVDGRDLQAAGGEEGQAAAAVRLERPSILQPVHLKHEHLKN